MGLAPQLVEEIFEIVKRLIGEQGVSVGLLAEQNTNMALEYAPTATSSRTAAW